MTDLKRSLSLPRRPALYVGKHAASFYAVTSLVHGSVALVVSVPTALPGLSHHGHIQLRGAPRAATSPAPGHHAGQDRRPHHRRCDHEGVRGVRDHAQHQRQVPAGQHHLASQPVAPHRCGPVVGTDPAPRPGSQTVPTGNNPSCCCALGAVARPAVPRGMSGIKTGSSQAVVVLAWDTFQPNLVPSSGVTAGHPMWGWAGTPSHEKQPPYSRKARAAGKRWMLKPRGGLRFVTIPLLPQDTMSCLPWSTPRCCEPSRRT